MLAAVARGTYLLVIGVMIVAWALAQARSETPATQNDIPDEPWSIYS